MRRLLFIAILGVLAVSGCWLIPEPEPEPPHILAIVFHADLEEGTGSTTTDQAASLTGTLTNMEEVDWIDRSGCFALAFDGTDELITFGDNIDLESDASFTVMAWIYPITAGEGNTGRIIDKRNGSSASWSFGVDDDTVNDGLFWLVNNSIVWSDATAITFNTWQHVAVSANGTNATFYTNGVAKGSPAFSTAPSGNAENLCIGNRASGESAFNGRIDDVRVYDTALTQGDIEAIYNSTGSCEAPAAGKRGQLIIISQ